MPALLINSAADGISGTAGSTLLIESTPKNKRATGWSVVQATATIVAIVATPIGGLIIESQGFINGFKISLLVSIATYLLSAAVLNTFLKETLKKKES